MRICAYNNFYITQRECFAINRKVKIIISAALTAAVMIVIFVMSGQTGSTSSGASNGVGAFLLKLLGIEVSPGQSPDTVVIIAGLQTRNLAHVFLYFCLGFSSYLLSASLWDIKFGLCPPRVLFSALCAAAFSLLYACSDELHQYFVPGRSATVRDILIDCIGIVLSVGACAVVQLLSWLIKKRALKNG